MLKKKINFRKVERKLVDDRVNKLRLEASNIEVGIIKRTQSSKDTSGKTFKGYSAEYKKRKMKSGRGRKVNLTDTGAMLHAISSKKITNGIRFYFNTSADRKKAFYNNKTRKFFGMDKSQIHYLKKKLNKL